MLKNYVEKMNDINTSIQTIGVGLLEANKLILQALSDCDEEKFKEVRKFINNVSVKTDEIDNSIINILALHQPEAKDLRTMVAFLKITNELMRACINTRSYVKGFQSVCKDVDLNTINEYTIPMQKATIDSIETAVAMLSIECRDELQESFNKVLICENKTDDLYNMLEQSLLKQSEVLGDFTKYHDLLSSLRKSEKIADRALGIASLMMFAKVGGEFHQN